MRLHPRRSRSALLGLLAAALTLGAGCGEDDDEVGVEVGEVELLESGEGEKIELPAPYERGQAVGNVFTITQSVDGPGLAFDVNVELEAESRVVSVQGGEATVEQTIESFTVDTGDQPVAGPELDALRELEGAVLATVYDEQGRQVGDIELVGGGRLPASFEGFEGGGTDVLYPDEPVGVGARWVGGVESQVEAGPPIAAEVTYELTDVSANEFTLEISGDTEIEDEFDGVEFTGDITQNGEVTGDPRNPLVFEMTYDVGFDASAEGETFSTDVSAEATSTEREPSG
jgi:hypothetical protein